MAFANRIVVSWILKSIAIFSYHLMTPVSSERSILAEKHLAKLGFATNITCSFTFPYDEQYVVRWDKYGETLFIHDPVQSFQLIKSGRIYIIDRQYERAVLQINSVTVRDAGNYTCSMIPKTSGFPKRHNRYIDVQDGPTLTNIPLVTENESISASCCVKFTNSVTRVTYLWLIGLPFDATFRDNFTFQPESPICSNVSFTAKRNDHNQMLECIVVNQLNSSAQHLIQVKFPASATWKPPHQSMTSLIAYQNSSLNITCLSDGYPPPNVTLQQYKKSLDIRWVNTFLIPELVNQEGTKKTWTFLYSFTSGTSDRLRCFSINNVTYDQNDNGFLVEAFIPVHVDMLSVRQYHDLGDNVTIRCATRGRPVPNVFLQKRSLDRWEILIQMIPTLTNVTQDLTRKTWEFQLTALTMELTGDYRCQANNTLQDYQQSNALAVDIYHGFDKFIMDNIQAIISLIVGVVVMLTVITAAICQRRNVSRNLFPVVTRYRGMVRNSRHFSNSVPPTVNVPDVCRNEAPSPPDTRNIPTSFTKLTEEDMLETYEELQDRNSNNFEEGNMVKAKLSEERVNYAVVQKKRVTDDSSEPNIPKPPKDETSYSVLQPSE